MAEKNLRTLTSGKMATTLMAYAQLEIDNSSTCIPRLCRFSIVRVVLNRAIDGADSNAIVVAVKIQSNKRTFRCCEISLQQDGTLDAPVNLQYLITYPHYFKRDINKIQIYIQRRKNRPMIGYKTLARGEINLHEVIQRPQSLDLHLYLNTNEKVKQNVRSPIHEDNSGGAIDDTQKRPIGYVSIVSLSSTIPTESTDQTTTTRSKFGLSTKRHHHHRHRIADFDKSLNDDDEYVEEEELNSELEDSDLEMNIKTKQQKFNTNILRNKIIKMFKRKANQTTNNQNSNTNRTTTNTTSSSHEHHGFIFDRQSDIEEDQLSDISDSTIPVDQWSIESVPKPGFTPVEQLQVLKFSEDDPNMTRKSTNPFDSNDSPLDSDGSDLGIDAERTNIPPPAVMSILEEKPSRPLTTTVRDSAVKQLDELYINDRLPETVIFLYTGINQANINASKFKEYNLSVISLSTLVDAKVALNNLIQRIQKNISQSQQIPVLRIVLLGNDAFVNSFLQSYVECLASRPHEYMNYFRFYFVPLIFSYLAKFLGSLDSQYESLFGGTELSNEAIDIRELSQKITRYLKTSQRTLALPVGEVMLNRKGRLPDEDSSPTFLPFFCYVRLGTLSSTSNDNQMSSIDDNILLSKSLSLSLSTNPQRESKDSSDEETSTTILTTSPQSKITNTLIKSSHTDETTSPFDISVDYWTIVGNTTTTNNNNDNQKEKKDGIRTIKSSLKSNIRILTITRQATINFDGKISSPLTMTYVTREKKQKSKFTILHIF
ncbi:unnamed protein product [Rotaria sp. Silwood1]|nr:unnamed protein product [Rotaria sp. Silwood1]CAF0860380.1 unnamed protein product [Rotaria sp. Silwood1]CAF0875877.1 unnamed protein product [Rotaria sp. Silwood1]CAF3355577.1 unnamed protein product [Rotaria sp. Silwood1]CAF3382778.1 unnamed protein product [Rotaria sp. Silwood1]